jgi:glyoxylase-like metal-dependent hydrolase (beta-lactamase superfamily II)
MAQEIKTIAFPMKMAGINMGTVNCYLITSGGGYLLIDTAFPNKRAALEKALESAGCHPGNLKLVVITHGDLDHTGNCAYLQKQYGARIAIHRYEAGVVERGDASLSRATPPLLTRIIGAVILRALSFLSRFGTFERFSPDLFVDEGSDLAEYGFAAKVVHLPGHSRGSVGILTPDGALFCGDLLWNMRKPGVHSIADDPAAMKASLEKLRSLGINTIYPGHGKPFTMDLLPR